MGSQQRSKYSKRGKFGKKQGRYSQKSKQNAEIKLINPNQSQTPTTSPSKSQFYISELIEKGLRIRICRDQSDGPSSFSQQMVTNHGVYGVKKVVEDGQKLKIILKKKKLSAISGYRLIDLDKINFHINEIVTHVSQCPAAMLLVLHSNERPYQLVSEVKRYGLASILLGRCMGCLETFYFHTSEKANFGTQRVYDVNARGVWGAMVTGGGCNALNEQAATFNRPGLTRTTFGKIENGIGHMWEGVVHEEMLSAGCEERRLAMARGDFHEGIPAVTVVCDGGWSKRSHKHSYNALGGVGVIIGAVTKKILYMGVRNKCCYICTRAGNQNKEPRQHECFENWTESSQAMEADIIVQGFMAAEKMHGLRFMRMVRDGDSSVYARVQEKVPVWGGRVQKLECANHITKCLRTKLEQLVADNSHYKGKNNLTKARRVKIVSTVRSAIAYHHEHPSTDRKTTLKRLKSDVLNSVHHVFGNHRLCSEFCKMRDKSIPKSSTTSDQRHSNLSKDHPDDSTDDFLQQTGAYWSEGMSTTDILEVRSAGDEFIEIDRALHRDVRIHLDRIAGKADKLLVNATTNLAECWMGMKMKFDGGKVINRCNWGSWGYRCYGALLRQNLGMNWAPITWEKTTGTSAGRAFEEEYLKRSRNLSKATEYQAKKQYKMNRWKKKVAMMKTNLTKKAKMEYGSDSLEVSSDLTSAQLEEKKTFFYEKEVNVSQRIMEHVEEQTRGQSLSGYWVDERKKRLTASNFASVVKRNPSISVLKLVEHLIYSTFPGTKLTRRGLRLERFAIKEYILSMKEDGEAVAVNSAGLFIDRDNPFLGASVDGLVVSDTSGEGIIEVKHVLMNKLMSLHEAASKMKFFCLEVYDGSLKLKKSHNFYYQIQGQLNVLKLPWADLVVRRVDPHQLHIQRIYRDIKLWTELMLPKLKAFYHKVLLPELAAPRYGKKPGIREPGTWYSADVKRQVIRRKQTLKRKTPADDTSASDGDTLSDEPATSEDHIKFLKKHILHEWLDDFGRSKWYIGFVLELTHGKDGDEDAEYEAFYEGSDGTYDVDHLLEDYRDGSLKFIK